MGTRLALAAALLRLLKSAWRPESPTCGSRLRSELAMVYTIDALSDRPSDDSFQCRRRLAHEEDDDEEVEVRGARPWLAP